MTILASISVAHAAYAGIIVAKGEGTAFDLLECESFEVGHLEALPEKVDGKDKRREITDVELVELVTRIEAILRAAHVEKVIIESPSVRSPLGSQVFIAIHDHVSTLPVELESIFSAWRYRLAPVNEYRSNAKDLAFKVFGSVSAFTYDSTIFAAALLAHVVLFETDPPLTKAERRRRQIAERRQQIAESHAAAVTAVPDLPEALQHSLEQLQTLAEVPASTVDPYEGAPVIAGVDSGSAFAALCVAQGFGTPLNLLELETFEMEQEVALKKPRTVTYSNRQTETITTKRVFSIERVREVAASIMARLLEHKVTHLMLEFADAAHIDNADKASASSIATQLMRTQWLWLILSERAEAAGIHVEFARAATWRAKVAGRIAGQVGGEGVSRQEGGMGLLREAIGTGFANWPEAERQGKYWIGDSNNHERDAAGLVLYQCILLQPEAKAPRKQRKAGKVTRKRRPNERARKAAADEARRLAGCTCIPGRRHRYTCKLAKISVHFEEAVKPIVKQ
jgi:hypothetical protein